MGCTYLATSDLHVGSNRKHPNYLQRSAKMLDVIFATAAEKTDGYVFINADVFDSHSPTGEEKDLVLTKIVEATKKLKLHVVLIDGNHDRYSKKRSSLYFLEVVARAIPSLLVVTRNPKVVQPKGFPVPVVAVPWTGADSTTFNTMVAELAKPCAKKPIVLFHEEILGCVDDSGWVSEKGIKLAKSLKVNCWLGGHIHKHQRLMKNAFYSGAPMAHKFSEENVNKGVLVGDTSNPSEPEFLHLKLPRLVTIQGYPDKFPKSAAAIKLIDLAPEDMSKPVPSNVVRRIVRSQISRQETPHEVTSEVEELTTLNLLEGLPAILQKKGLDDDQVRFAMTQSQQLLKKFRG